MKFPKNPKPNEEVRLPLPDAPRIVGIYRYAGNGAWKQIGIERTKTATELDMERVLSAGESNHAKHTVGHDSMSDPFMRPNPAVQAMKDRVFGSRTGETEMFWFHGGKGIVTLTARGDMIHSHVERDPTRHTRDPEVISVLRDPSGIVAYGRIEHRSGRGLIMVTRRGAGSLPPSVVRSLRRRYPRHAIMDPYGREIMEGRGLATFRDWIGEGRGVKIGV